MSHIKSRLVAAALLFSLSTFTSAAVAQKEGPDKEAALAAALDHVIDASLKQNRLVGAVVLIAHDGEMVYHRAAGHMDREAKIPMREDAIFRLSSVSKPFTSMAAAALIQQDKMSLDDPVTKWLPDFTPALPKGGPATITIRQLMTHTAGLNYGFLEKKDGPYLVAGISDGLDSADLSLEENLKRLASVPLLYDPGTVWHYSLATDVLGAVIAKAHGTTLPQAMHDLVTEPLGLADTGFVVTDQSRLAVPYYNAQPQPLPMQAEESLSLGDGEIRLSPSRALNPKAFPSGGAGMVGTAPEVMSLLETICKGGGPLAGPELMKEMTVNQVGKNRVQPGVGFGLGWAVVLDPIEANTPQSAGTLSWSGVYGHTWFVDPARKLSVVILTNTAFEGMIGQTVTDIRNAVYGNLLQ